MANNSTPIHQIYYGEMDANSRVFRFAIQCEFPSPDAPPTATLLSMDEGNARFPLTEFEMEKGKMAFQLKSTGATFEGTSNDGGDEYRGTWKQRSANLPLHFKRVDTLPKDLPTEIWRGTLKTGLQNLELQLRGYKKADGVTHYYLDSLSQKVGGFKADFALDDTTLKLSVGALRAKFDGKLNDARDEATGKWNQSIPLDLTLRKSSDRTASTAMEFKRPQTPVPPFPYEITEVLFSGAAESVQLAGTLTYPSKGNRYPLAILISGSGPQDRDETLLDHKPFWILADHLTRKGIAVLRYDERGVGKSQGNFSTATTRDFADDVQAAVRFAKTLDQVDAQKIGLIGHSEGGIVGPMVAAQDPSIAWLVLMAGTGVNGEAILLSQGELIMAVAGGTDAEKRRQRAIQTQCFELLKKISPSDKIDSHVDATTDAILKALGELPSDDESIERRQVMSSLVRASLQTMHTPWFRYFMTHEPGPVLEKVKCPVLAMNGEKDVQVDPRLNLPKIEEWLQRGGNQRVTVRTLPSLNHMFQTCVTGELSEYQTIEESFAPVALQLISEWITEQGKQ